MPSTTNGVIWSAIERFSVQGISFILGIVIARLITPGEYGLIAMLTIFMAIAQSFIDSGFGNALIQKKDRNEVDYSTVFYFNFVISIILYGILYLCAPFIANFYNQPILTSITRWIGLNLICNSLSIVQRTRLTIDLNFKLQAKISLAAVIISGILGIILAYLGWGVWALVAQSISLNLLTTMFLWIGSKWHPLWIFSVNSFKRLFSFGSKLLLSGLLHTIYMNLYSLVIGKVYNPSDVGYYNRAYSISQYPATNFVTIITRVIYPVQCAHQDDDDWLKKKFEYYIRLTCFIVVPLMTYIAIIAKPLVAIVLTNKWIAAAPLISILSIAFILYPIMVFNNQMLYVKGRSDLFLKAELIKKTLAIIILCLTLPFGLLWLCRGILIYNILDTLLIISFTKKVFSTGYYNQIIAILPFIVISAIAGLVSWNLYYLFDGYWLQFLICSIIFWTIYLAVCKVLKICELNQIKNILHVRN